MGIGWKEYLYFTRRERRGIILLVLLIIGVYTAPRLFRLFNTDKHRQAERKRRQQESELAFVEFERSLRLQEQNRKKLSPSHHTESVTVTLSEFDPNTADSATFRLLGLPGWMARNVLRYRAKQGVFRRPEDFRKIYGMADEQYETLRPYIRIAETYQPKDTTRLFSPPAASRDSAFKYTPGSVTVELNTADTTELKKIPGIGSGIARMIVNYREQLGGFHRIEQLQEIRIKAEKLRPWLTIETARIKRIPLNQAGVERLMRHPYINFYQAKAIVEHRKQRGDLTDLKQLSLYEEFTPDDLERLAPYVSF